MYKAMDSLNFLRHSVLASLLPNTRVQANAPPYAGNEEGKIWQKKRIAVETMWTEASRRIINTELIG